MSFRKYGPLFDMRTSGPRRVITVDCMTGNLILQMHGDTIRGLCTVGARMTPDEAHDLALALLHFEERARRIAVGGETQEP